MTIHADASCRGFSRSGRAALAGSLALCCLLGAQSAHADCRIEGSLTQELVVYADRTGNKTHARLSGDPIAGVVDRLPATKEGRARLVTRGFRVEGYADLASVPLRLERDVPVVQGHAWLTRGSAVTIASAEKDRIKVRAKASWPLQPAPEQWTTCSAVALGSEAFKPAPVAGHARGYVLDDPWVELFASANSEPSLLRAYRSESAPLLFWSTEPAGTRVRVRYDGKVRIDAWALTSRLRALPVGETMDQVETSISTTKSGSSALGESARKVVAAAAAPLFVVARDGVPPIGVVEAGTPIYVLSVMRGWASVLPQSLAVLPSGTGRFWVRAERVGL